MKKILLLATLLCWPLTSLWAQNRFNITGSIADSTTGILPGATVMLLNRADSVLLNFTRSDTKGIFEFKNVKKGDYLLKTSFVGYIPAEKAIIFGASERIDLGIVYMKEIADELMEVVVRTAKAPLTMRGDTIEYNAASFKVPPGSTVEDLLRRLPGVEVDAEGNIKAQGQDVKKVTVDGKTFFSDDPKTATKNLPAEAITKVQVFNDKSEQAKATGIDDGKKEKTVNLQLKDEFKKGGFGKASVAAGLPEQGDIRASYNKFNSKHQFSMLGFVNNTNQTGLSWNDYQDFRGSAMQNNWGDDVDFGFVNGRQVYYFDADNDEGMNIPVGGGQGRGFSQNAAAGINYNFDNAKTKINSNYYFNATDLDLAALRTRESFLAANSFKSTENSTQENVYGNHRLSFRLEQQIDSTKTLTVKTSNRLGISKNTLKNAQSFTGASGNTQSSIDNDSKNLSLSSESWLMYRHKLKKKGRSYALSGTFLLNDADAEANQSAVNRFNTIDTTNILKQNNSTITDRNQLKASALFIEPISKTLFVQTFYNTSLRLERVDRNVYNRVTSESPRLDELSSYYNNRIFYNRLGASLNYNNKGKNLSFGLAALQIDLEGELANSADGVPLANIKRRFQNITPNVDMNFELKNQQYLSFGYDMSVNEPQTRDLQPVIDNSNPVLIREGNPDLKPAVSHNTNLSYNMFNMATFINFYAGLNYSLITNSIVYNQTIDPKTFVSTSKPQNVKGGQTFSAYGSFGFPLKKTISTLNLNANASLGQNPNFINGIENETNSQNYSIGARFSLTPSKFFSLYAGGNVGYNKAAYSLESAPSQEFFNNSANAETNISFGKGLYLNSRFTYTLYSNAALNFRQEVPIWNAAIFKVLGKKQRAELRLSAFDILNQNVGISQNASQNFVSYEEVNTLARYFMLGFTYNMRGIKHKVAKSNGWN